MKRLFSIASVFALAACLAGCASQVFVERHYYEPTEATAVKREDGLTVGALKAEITKEGQPDWSPKSISVISVGR